MAPAAATKKRTKKKPHAVVDDDDDDDVDGWMTADDGWTGVNVNTNALMLGASEEGFMSLEVLDASSAKAAVAAATRGDSGTTTTAVEAKPKEKIKIFGGDFVAMDKPAKDAGTKAGAKGKGAAKAPSTLNALDEDALDGLSGKEARIMKRKLRWKAKIEAKKLAKKNGESVGGGGDGVAVKKVHAVAKEETKNTKDADSAKPKSTQASRKEKKKAAEKNKEKPAASKHDEELIEDAALDVEEDWEKITRKSAPSSSSGGRVVQGVDVNSGCDVSAWFEFDLHPLLLRAIQDAGFTTPSPIQRECLPPAMKGRCDVIGAAQTGSGKTLAFALPILHRLLSQGIGLPDDDDEDKDDDDEEKSTRVPREVVPDALRALIVAPTRELALQVCAMMRAVAVYTKIDVCPVVGGMSKEKQERLLNRKPAVIVATPGRLWDTMQSGHPHLTELGALSFFVLDEADRMVERGHFRELTSIIENIPQPPKVKQRSGKKSSEALGKEEEDEVVDDAVFHAEDAEREKALALRPSQMLDRQTFVFSATLTVPDSVRRKLRKGKPPAAVKKSGATVAQSGSLESLMECVPFYSKVKLVDLTTKERKGGAVAASIAESALECTEEDRDSLLYYLLSAHPGMTIVFVNAISCLRRVVALLKILNVPVEGLHAGMQQRMRLKGLDRFKSALKNGKHSVLVATDVAARGLDVKGVELVIHYQIPRSADTYIHRSGRTGRADQLGAAVSLVTPKERAQYYALLKSLNRDGPLDAFPIAEETLIEASRRLAVARKIDRLAHTKKKSKADKEWRRTNAEELGIILSESESDDDLQEYHEEQSAKNEAAKNERKFRAELDRMLAIPLGSHRHSLIGSAKFPSRGGGEALLKAKNARLNAERSVSAVNMLAMNSSRAGSAGRGSGTHTKKRKAGDADVALPAAVAGAIAGGVAGRRKKTKKDRVSS